MTAVLVGLGLLLVGQLALAIGVFRLRDHVGTLVWRLGPQLSPPAPSVGGTPSASTHQQFPFAVYRNGAVVFHGDRGAAARQAYECAIPNGDVIEFWHNGALRARTG